MKTLLLYVRADALGHVYALGAGALRSNLHDPLAMGAWILVMSWLVPPDCGPTTHDAMIACGVSK